MFCNAQISKLTQAASFRNDNTQGLWLLIMVFFCLLAANDEQRVKLTKLLSLWESKGNFFDACVISKLKSPPSSLQEYQTSLVTQHANVVAAITQATKNTFEK